MNQLQIRCVITDDEPLARKGLQGYVEKTDFLQLAGVCEDALQLNTFLKQQSVDLLFLDIEMPYLTGIDFLRNLANPPQVILTTAYDNYALQGFELNVLDYLLKPVSFERFFKAANKAHDYFSLRQEGGQDYFFVKTDYRLEKVSFADILFAEAMENYVALYLTDRKIITHATLKSVQEYLPGTIFLQPHKSYLVNMQHINAIQGNVLHIGNFEVPISKYQKEDVLERIVNNKMLNGKR